MKHSRFVLILGLMVYLHARAINLVAPSSCKKSVAGVRIPFEQSKTSTQDDKSAPWSNSVSESHTNIQGFVKTPAKPNTRKNLEMYYRIDFPKNPNGKEWVWLQHGLGDHSGQMNSLTSLFLQQGYTVIRADLLGHARSLSKNRERVDINDPTNMSEHGFAMAEIARVAKKQGMKSVRLIGHSLGGAAVLKLASVLRPGFGKPDEVNIKSISLIAFYAQDLGDWMYSQAVLGRPVTESVTEVIKFVSPRQIGENVDSSYHTAYYMFSQFYFFFQAMVGYTGVSKLNENLLWPQLSKFMYSSYEPYFRAYSEKTGVDINDARVKDWLDEQIRSAIAVTKGARSFNLFHPSEILPNQDIPIQIIAGSKDELVPLSMMKQAKIRFQDLGFKVILEEIPEAGHLMTRLNSQQVYEKLISHQYERNNE